MFIAFCNELPASSSGQAPPVGSVAIDMYFNILSGDGRVRLTRTQVICKD